jgi:hypothetical protein
MRGVLLGNRSHGPSAGSRLQPHVEKAVGGQGADSAPLAAAQPAAVYLVGARSGGCAQQWYGAAENEGAARTGRIRPRP